MTRIEEIISNALAGIEETEVAILARELLKTREALALALQARGEAEGRAAMADRRALGMKPHVFAAMVNEVRALARQYGQMEQFRCRVADLLGTYIRVEHNSKGVPEQSEIGTHAVVVPPLPKPTGRRADDAPVWGMPQDLEDVCRQAGNPVLAAYQVGIRRGHAIAQNSVRAIPADRVLGEGEIKGTPEELAKIAESAGWKWIRSPIESKETKTLVEWMTDALRANQGGADHA